MNQSDILSQLARIRRNIHLNKAKFLVSYCDEEETLESSDGKLQLSNQSDTENVNVAEILEQARYYENQSSQLLLELNKSKAQLENLQMSTVAQEQSRMSQSQQTISELEEQILELKQ